MNREQELRNCTQVKVILMLLIVLYHSMAIFAPSAWGPYIPVHEAPFWGYLAEWLNSFHIYTFVLISGYIFCFKKYEKGDYHKYFLFLWNKVMRLLVPYVIITTVWVGPVYVHYFGKNDLVEKYVLGTSPSQLWFLLMLFWVFAIFWLLSDIVNRKPVLGGVCVCLLYCVGLIAPSIYCMNKGLLYLLFFYIGFVMRKFNLSNKVFYKVSNLVYILADVMIFVVCRLLDGYDKMILRVLFRGCNVLLNIVGAIGAFILLQRFTSRFLQENKIVVFLSLHSMVIYLVHQQLIYFSIGWFNAIVFPAMLVLINFVFSLALSTLFSVLMHKTKVTRFLIGSK